MPVKELLELTKKDFQSDQEVRWCPGCGDYAILKAMEDESKGAVRPEIGSLYRVLARLMSLGFVDEVTPPAKSAHVHRGQPRRYYRLTRKGRAALKADARRLESALAIARARALLPEGSSS